MRSNLVESEHFGVVVLANADGSIQSWGNSKFTCFTRSIIKSIQVKISKEILGDELKDELLAISMASHNAEPEQLTQINNLMNKFKLCAEDLYCGIYGSASYSLDSPLKHNCSGKHFAMLAASAQSDWGQACYYELEHPIQQAIKAELERLLGSKIERSGIDGCGLPSFYMSLEEMARVFQKMIQDPSYQEIIDAMQNYPLLIGGKNQIDSLLMATNKHLIAKTGAEGLVMIANLKEQAALVIKIIDGAKRVKATVASSICKELGWLEHEPSFDETIYNSRKEAVGCYAACVLGLE